MVMSMCHYLILDSMFMSLLPSYNETIIINETS